MKDFTYEGEVNTGDIITEPNLSMTVEEIINQANTGQMPNSIKVAFGINDDIDNPDRFNSGYDVDMFDAIDELRIMRQKESELISKRQQEEIAYRAKNSNVDVLGEADKASKLGDVTQ